MVYYHLKNSLPNDRNAYTQNGSRLFLNDRPDINFESKYFNLIRLIKRGINVRLIGDGMYITEGGMRIAYKHLVQIRASITLIEDANEQELKNDVVDEMKLKPKSRKYDFNRPGLRNKTKKILEMLYSEDTGNLVDNLMDTVVEYNSVKQKEALVIALLFFNIHNRRINAPDSLYLSMTPELEYTQRTQGFPVSMQIDFTQFKYSYIFYWYCSHVMSGVKYYEVYSILDKLLSFHGNEDFKGWKISTIQKQHALDIERIWPDSYNTTSESEVIDLLKEAKRKTVKVSNLGISSGPSGKRSLNEVISDMNIDISEDNQKLEILKQFMILLGEKKSIYLKVLNLLPLPVSYSNSPNALIRKVYQFQNTPLHVLQLYLQMVDDLSFKKDKIGVLEHLIQTNSRNSRPNEIIEQTLQSINEILMNGLGN